jgi:predicted glycoside hydrolase/deacetylase ChbG (UPF0249 family)
MTRAEWPTAASWSSAAGGNERPDVEIMIILCADDYALTEGISRAIGQLAAARRLSATSAMVTSPHWPAMAPRLLVHRPYLAVGLHLDLTHGRPLGAVPRLAPHGRFAGLRSLMLRAFLGRLDGEEVRAEIDRQFSAFEQMLGVPPDHVDGHQHIQVLPGVRTALLEVIARRYPRRTPLVRNPADRFAAIYARRTAAPKAALVAALAAGFGPAAERFGIPSNDTFAGFSDFSPQTPYAEEFARALLQAGPRHIVMCHPGREDENAGTADDPIAARRPMEYEALMREPSLPGLLWRPSRTSDGPPVAWSQL